MKAWLRGICFLCSLVAPFCWGVPNDSAPYAVSIPAGGNSWVAQGASGRNRVITNRGVENWSRADDAIRIFFRAEDTGNLAIALRAKVQSGASQLACTLGDRTHPITLNNTDFDTVEVGVFTLVQPGYHTLTLRGTRKTGPTFAEVSDVLIGGDVSEGKMFFVKDDFYFGRRGPSVHLSYELPEAMQDVLYFYNEVTVPAGQDVVGSFFMANGFGEGYFGMQVNSAQERRILFSVWSPYRTDNPQEIPAEQRIKLLKKGDTVHAGKFGGEGSGGQSFRRYLWKAGTSYRFLLKGEPVVPGATDFTAYFYAPEIGQWELIASFRRPQTNTYLKRPHSFLENFIPAAGQYSRKGLYGNQWICNTHGQWTELTKARFTADVTARKEARLDYMGGAEGDAFFLKNCGFFNERSEIGTFFTRKPTGKKPEINLQALP